MMTMIKRELTLFFKYKDLSGKISEHEAFLTVTIDANDVNAYEKQIDWLNQMMELKIKSDPEVAGVYISDEVKPLTKKELKEFNKNNVISLNKEKGEQ